MDNIVTSIQGLSSTSDGALGQLQAYLKGQGNTLCSASLDAILQAVHSLDLAQHSLGAMWLLEAACKHTSPARGPAQVAGDSALIDLLATFFTCCQARQIRLVPDMFVKLGRKFRELLMAYQCPRKGILPLQAAIRALQPTAEHLTPLHAECFLLCILSKCYNAACRLLSEDIFFVEPVQTSCTPRDLFLYCKYGSQLCIGRKQWQRALELQLIALTAPALAGNTIVLDCYKQYVLVSLISQGNVPALPKSAPQVLRSLVESDCRPYTELVNAYSSHTPSRLARVVEQHHTAFAQDNNMGLIGQVMDSLQLRNIQRLTTTYLTLPLAHIAQEVGLPSADAAEDHLLQMVADGDIFASISARDGGMVSFLDDPEAFTSSAAATRLADAVAGSMALSERLAAMQQSLAASKEYLKKVITKDRSKFDAGEELAAGVAGPSGMGIGAA